MRRTHSPAMVGIGAAVVVDGYKASRAILSPLKGPEPAQFPSTSASMSPLIPYVLLHLQHSRTSMIHEFRHTRGRLTPEPQDPDPPPSPPGGPRVPPPQPNPPPSPPHNYLISSHLHGLFLHLLLAVSCLPLQHASFSDQTPSGSSEQNRLYVAYQALAPLVQLPAGSCYCLEQATLSFVYKELHDSVHLVTEFLLLR